MTNVPKPLPRTKIRQPVVQLSSDAQTESHLCNPHSVINIKQELQTQDLNERVSDGHSAPSIRVDTITEVQFSGDNSVTINENCGNPLNDGNDDESEMKFRNESPEIKPFFGEHEEAPSDKDDSSSDYPRDNGDEDDEIVNEILKYKHGNYERKLQESGVSTGDKSSDKSKNLLIEGEDNDDVLGIHIIRTDCLKMDRIIRHPSVVVHIVDSENNGGYLQKRKPDKNVTYNQEKSSFILPVMTKPYNFKQNKCIIPKWEEILVFNENTSEIIKSTTIFFFEIVDFIDSSNSSDAEYGSFGWHHIAWAFLKPIGANNSRNIDQLLRLQLYESDPKSTSINNSNAPNVYFWYQKRKWKQYPSTIYVTIRNVSPEIVDAKPQQRSCTPFQPEIGSDSSVKSLDILSNESSDSNIPSNMSAIHRLGNIEWNRLPGQSCRIPKSKIATLHPDPKGCLAMKFSNSGLFLACGASSNVFIVAIDGVLEKKLISHQDLIYTLNWSIDDSYLLSASGDGTACIWDMKSSKENPIQILPHPTFVYCSTFIYPEPTIVTACYDGIIRIWWHTHATSKHWQLHQELVGHEEYVTALTSFKNKEFFSGDVRGLIIHWIADEYSRWFKLNVIKLTEIQGTVINKLVVFPGQKRLLIHTRDSLLRTMDIKTSVIIQWYQGGLNDTCQCNCVVTPCGGLIFANSEDGTVNVWESNTGKHLAFYSSGTIGSREGGSIDYHPHDHICAFSCYSTGNTPLAVHLLKYSTNYVNADVALYLLNETGDQNYDGYYNKLNYNRSSREHEFESEKRNWKKNKSKTQERTKIK